MAQGRSVVGFIGLGAIGNPMAERLVQGGEDVVVYNRTIGKTARFRDRAKITASPAEMADVRYYFCVRHNGGFLSRCRARPARNCSRQPRENLRPRRNQRSCPAGGACCWA